MQSIDLSITRDADQVAGGETVVFYGDGGTGTLSTDTPLNVQPIELTPGLDSPVAWLTGPWLTESWLRPADEAIVTAVGFTTDPIYFGVRQFAAAVLDAAGNEGLGETTTMTINSAPRAPRSIGLPTQDDEQLVFAIAGSPDIEE